MSLTATIARSLGISFVLGYIQNHPLYQRVAARVRSLLDRVFR